MKIKKSQLVKLIKEFKRISNLNTYDFSDYQSGSGNFDLPPEETPEKGGGSGRNYPQEVINKLRLVKELGIGPLSPTPDSSELFNESGRKQVEIDLAGPGEERRTKILVVRALDRIESENRAPIPPKIELQFGFRVYYGTEFPDFTMAEQKKINCFSESHVSDIIEKVLEFTNNIKLISEAELEDELVRNFKNRNFLQKYGRL